MPPRAQAAGRCPVSPADSSSLRDILNLKVGSRIMLNAMPDSRIELRCGQIPMFFGTMGRKGTHIAVRVDDKIRKDKV